MSALPALLICYAVVLNLGPFSRVAPGHAVGAPDTAVASTAMGRGADEPELPAGVVPPSLEAVDGSAPMTPLASRAVAESAAAQGATPSVASQAQFAQPAPIPVSDVRARDALDDGPLVAGIWAPSASACSLRDLREGWLPTIIDADGARAGDTYCTFTNRRQTATEWRVVATCSDTHQNWRVAVRLAVKDDHLIWTSSRGRQVYTRCAPDSLITAAR